MPRTGATSRERRGPAGSAASLKEADPMALADPQRIEALDPLDPLALDAELSDEERMVRDTARAYATDALMPRVTSAFLDERFDREIMRELGQVGLPRSEEHTSELKSLMRITYAGLCLKNTNQ